MIPKKHLKDLTINLLIDSIIVISNKISTYI